MKKIWRYAQNVNKFTSVVMIMDKFIGRDTWRKESFAKSDHFCENLAVKSLSHLSVEKIGMDY